MSSKKNQSNKEDLVKRFVSGQVYKIINYELDKSYDLEILSRKGKWITILLDGVKKEVRAYRILRPQAESILIENFLPIYSYQNDEKEQDYE